MAKKRLNKDTKITSTSDVTVGDLVEAVAENIESGASRMAVERVVKATVRPCALGRIPTVVADSACDGADGNTKRFSHGKLRPGQACATDGGCDGSPSEAAEQTDANDIDLEVAPRPEGRFATFKPGDIILPRARSGARGMKVPAMATTSKWYDMVLQNGEVWTPYTSRRFLPAQYLGLMLSADGNVDAAIARRYTLRDCWRLLDTEIEKLIFMEKHWYSAFAERRHFLPIAAIKEIFREYLDALHANLNDKSKCSFKKSSGEYWRRIQGEGRVVLWKKEISSEPGENGYQKDTTTVEPSVWLEDINSRIAAAKSRINDCNTYSAALSILRNRMPQISMGTFKDGENRIRSWLPKAWKAAFKKAGAYYTLKSLVVNCHVRYTTEEGDWRHRVSNARTSAREGLNDMLSLVDESVPAFVVHAILKKSIEASRFDIGKFLRTLRRR